MPCLDFDVDIPDLDFFISPPLIPKVPLPIGAEFCCKFEVNDPGIDAARQAANSIITNAATALGSEVMVAFMVINEGLAVARYGIRKLREYAPECPIDAVSVG